MPILPILTFPNSILRKKAKVVKTVSEVEETVPEITVKPTKVAKKAKVAKAVSEVETIAIKA